MVIESSNDQYCIGVPLAFLQALLILFLVDVLKASNVVPPRHAHAEVDGNRTLQAEYNHDGEACLTPRRWQHSWPQNCAAASSLLMSINPAIQGLLFPGAQWDACHTDGYSQSITRGA